MIMVVVVVVIKGYEQRNPFDGNGDGHRDG